jgi:hypothetical protein
MMDILITTPGYVDSVACTVVDGLLGLGHRVYVDHDRPLNYAEPAPVGFKPDVWIMADTDNLRGCIEPPPAGVLKVIMHGHDRFRDYNLAPNSSIKPVPYDTSACDVMFVRDLNRQETPHHYPVYPINYGIERRYQEACQPYLDGERKWAVVFFGTLSTAFRRAYLEKVKNSGMPVTYGAYQFNDPDTKWSRWIYGRYVHDPSYYKKLCDYMFGFAPIGAGWSCFRHMELYAAGCIPVIQRYAADIDSLHDFQDGENCILWSSGDELVSKLLDWQNHQGEAEQLRQRCYRYGQEHLLTRHVAQFMLDRLKGESA